MAIGSFALVVSVAVLNGFESLVQSRIVGFEGDLRITGDLGSNRHLNLDWILQHPDVERGAPFLERKALVLGRESASRVVNIKAVDLESLEMIYDLGVVDRSESLEQGVMLGSVLAERLNLSPGDLVTLYSPVDGLSRLGAPSQIRLPVMGVFTSKVLDYDDKIAFIPWDTGLKLFSRKTTVDGVDLRVTPGTDLGALKQSLETIAPVPIRVESWADLHENLFHAMRMERIGAMIILSLIIVVAAFNLATTLILVTIQKIQEIGILQTLGLTTRQVSTVLMKQGFLIGGTGLLSGFTVGVILVVLQSMFGLIPLPSDIYALSTLPMVLYGRDIILILLITILCILFATRVAGNRAIKIEPKVALQMEK